MQIGCYIERQTDIKAGRVEGKETDKLTGRQMEGGQTVTKTGRVKGKRKTSSWADTQKQELADGETDKHKPDRQTDRHVEEQKACRETENAEGQTSRKQKEKTDTKQSSSTGKQSVIRRCHFPVRQVKGQV